MVKNILGDRDSYEVLKISLTIAAFCTLPKIPKKTRLVRGVRLSLGMAVSHRKPVATWTESSLNLYTHFLHLASLAVLPQCACAWSRRDLSPLN